MRPFLAWTTAVLITMAMGCAMTSNWDRDGHVKLDPNARVANPSRFSLISTSMTLKQVVKLLGPPTEVSGSGMYYLNWLTPAGGRFTVAPGGSHRTNTVVWIFTDKLYNP